jgi:hypothetical protein
MLGAIHSLPQYAFMVWCSVKKKHRDNSLMYNILYMINYAIVILTPWCRILFEKLIVTQLV